MKEFILEANRLSSLGAIFLSIPWCCLIVPVSALSALGTTSMTLDREIGTIVIPLLSWPLLAFSHFKFWNKIYLLHKIKKALKIRPLLLNFLLLVLSTTIVIYYSVVQLHGDKLWDSFCGNISSLSLHFMIFKDFLHSFGF